MNERIKLLAEQAYEYALAESKDGVNICALGSDYFLAMEKEKFAELIVRECIDICRYHPSIIVSNNWSGHDVAQDIAQMIREHFGVEE